MLKPRYFSPLPLFDKIQFELISEVTSLQRFTATTTALQAQRNRCHNEQHIHPTLHNHR